MCEVWKSVPDYEGIYEVSDHGRVRGVSRIDGRGHHRETSVKPPTLAGPKGKQYLQVQLYRMPKPCPCCGHRERSKGQARKVHLLVLEAFISPRPPGMQGCHNNGDKLDNRLENLRWGTPGSNTRDKRDHGTNHRVNKTHCPRGHEYSETNTYGGANNSARRCKECARERARTQSAPVKLRTHCRKGHELTGGNVIINGNARKCRTCANARQRVRYAARTVEV